MIVDVGWRSPCLIAYFVNEELDEGLDLWLLQIRVLGSLALAQRFVGIAAMAELFDGAMDLADAVVKTWHLKDFGDKGVLEQRRCLLGSWMIEGQVLGGRVENIPRP